MNSPAPDVLVVDDDPGVRLLVSSVLEDAGLRVRTSPDGQSALTALRQRPPAVVVLDIEMPRMDGRTFARELRKAEDPPPILVLSAHRPRDVAAEIGAEAWIEKPFDETRLITYVRRLIARRRDTPSAGRRDDPPR